MELVSEISKKMLEIIDTSSLELSEKLETIDFVRNVIKFRIDTIKAKECAVTISEKCKTIPIFVYDSPYNFNHCSNINEHTVDVMYGEGDSEKLFTVCADTDHDVVDRLDSYSFGIDWLALARVIIKHDFDTREFFRKIMNELLDCSGDYECLDYPMFPMLSPIDAKIPEKLSSVKIHDQKNVVFVSTQSIVLSGITLNENDQLFQKFVAILAGCNVHRLIDEEIKNYLDAMKIMYEAGYCKSVLVRNDGTTVDLALVLECLVLQFILFEQEEEGRRNFEDVEFSERPRLPSVLCKAKTNVVDGW